MPNELRSGTAVDPDAVTRAEGVLERAQENGDRPDAVVFHDNHAPGHPDRFTNSETFSLVYGPPGDDTDEKEVSDGA